jgi:branched-chain amino acid transport system substrate-binding protein
MVMNTASHAPRRRSILKAAALGATLAAPAIARAQVGPIKLGFLSPLSGPLAFVGQTSQNCMALAVREVNAAGGILGRPVEVVAEDSQMSTTISVDKTRKMVSSEGVVLITGMVLPGELQGALQVATAAKRMVFYPNFSDGRCHANLLSMGLQPSQTIDPLTNWLLKNVGKKVFIISSDLTNLRNVSVPRISTGFERGGGSVAAIQFFPFGTRDFGPVLQQVRDANPDVVWHYIGDDPSTFVKQYKSFGLRQQLASEIANEPLNVVTAGASTGMVGVSTYFMSLDNAANRKFLDDYTAAYKGFTDRRVDGKVTMHPVGEATYNAVKIFAEAAKLAGSVELDKLKAALHRVSLDLPRGNVKVAMGSGHVVCQSHVGRVQADNSFEILESSNPTPGSCA